jgi:hypothetical protein
MTLRNIIRQRAFKDEPILEQEDLGTEEELAPEDEMGSPEKPESEKLDLDALKKALMDGEIKADEAQNGVIDTIVEIIKALNRDSWMKVIENLPEESKAMMREQLGQEDMETGEEEGEEETEI